MTIQEQKEILVPKIQFFQPKKNMYGLAHRLIGQFDDVEFIVAVIGELKKRHGERELRKRGIGALVSECKIRYGEFKAEKIKHEDYIALEKLGSVFESMRQPAQEVIPEWVRQARSRKKKR